ncbi:MAG: multidrug effflux MFS transporter [Roseiflexaceae bacterium]
MYLPGLTTIATDLGTDAGAVGQTLSIFFLGLAFGQAFYGPLSDRFGRKIPLLVGCLIYTIASIGCALAPTIEWLTAFRLLQSLGGCAGMVLSRSVVRDYFEQRDAARMFSWLMLVMGIAPITAPLIGGVLLDAFGWRAIFWALALFGVICVLLVSFLLAESLPAERRTNDGIGQALRTYLHILGDRQFMGYALTGGFVSAAMFSYITGSPFVVMEIYGLSAQQFSLMFGANAFGLILASQANRWLLERLSGEAIVAFILATTASSSVLLLTVVLTGWGGIAALLIALFGCIISVGLVGPNTTAAAMANHSRTAGSASALLGTLQFGLGSLAGTLVGALHDQTARPMAGVIMLCAFAALASYHLLIPRRQTSLAESA